MFSLTLGSVCACDEVAELIASILSSSSCVFVVRYWVRTDSIYSRLTPASSIFLRWLCFRSDNLNKSFSINIDWQFLIINSENVLDYCVINLLMKYLVNCSTSKIELTLTSASETDLILGPWSEVSLSRTVMNVIDPYWVRLLKLMFVKVTI